mgnify:CR=1 FL=1
MLDHRDYRQLYIMDLRRIYLTADISVSASSEVTVSGTIFGSYQAYDWRFQILPAPSEENVLLKIYLYT